MARAREDGQQVRRGLLRTKHELVALGHRAKLFQRRRGRGRGERRAIVKSDTGAELEFPALELGVMPPGDRQGRLGPGRLVEGDQPIEHQRCKIFLRRKLARYGPDLIHTQRGVGYCLRMPRPEDTHVS